MIPDQYRRTIENSRLVRNEKKEFEEVDEGNLRQSDISATREETDLMCRTLRAMIYGTDGIGLAQENRSQLIDINIVSRLAVWIQDATGRSRNLWIDFPFEFQEDSPARAAALSIISLAARAKAPFLSYICHKPRQAELTNTQTPENAGLLSIVYSLILQLLRFRPSDDQFMFDRALLTRLNGDMTSWDVALRLLASLLEHTAIVRYCIIHGLNEFETKDGVIRCNELLNVLFSSSHRPENPFSILFTTSGQSRTLYGVIDQKDRISSDQSKRGVDKRGLDLDGMTM